MSNMGLVEKKNSFKMFDQIASTYDFLNHTLSFGIDILWRKKLLSFVPRTQSISALDLATGTGDVAISLTQIKNVKHIVGLDLSRGMLRIGREKVKKKKLNNIIQLEHGDGVDIPRADKSFNLVTLSFGIRNFPDVPKSLENIYRVLTPGGRCLIMELSMPQNRLINFLYTFYFRYILTSIGKLLSRHNSAYTYLNNTVEDFPSGSKFLSLLHTAGFKDLKAVPLTFGIATLYVADKPFEEIS